MTEAAAGYAVYRASYAGVMPQSIEAEGIADPAIFAKALNDPETLTINTADGQPIPLLVPARLFPYLNIAYYIQRAAESGARSPDEIVYYSHLPLLVEGDDGPGVAALRPALRALAARGGVMIYDHAGRRGDAEHAGITRLIQAIGGVACQDVSSMPKHYHYVSVVQRAPGHPEVAVRTMDFVALYQAALASENYVAHPAIEVTTALSDDDCMQVAAFYEKAHAPLTAADVIAAGFSPEELREVLTAPAFTKIVYRGPNGRISNLSIVADVRACPWLNQTYFEQQFSDAYRAGRIICGIGAISDPDVARGKGMISPGRATARVVGDMLAVAGGEQVFVFACDDVSDGYIPRISQAAFRAAGLLVDFTRPVDHQEFHALVLEPAE